MAEHLKRGRGRPRNDPGERRLNVPLPGPLKARLSADAKREGMLLRWYVARVLQRGLDAEGGQ